MILHSDLWQALDTLASDKGLSTSGLAKLAGLDPTIFNRSKRQTRDGRPHWPSLASLLLTLDAAGMSLGEFAALLESGKQAPTESINENLVLRRASFSQLSQVGLFSPAGLPAGKAWEDWGAIPDPGPYAYAIDVDLESLEPLFRHGCTLIVAPGAAIRKNDRAIICDLDGRISVGIVRVRDVGSTTLDQPNGSSATYHTGDIRWIHRIALASQ